MWTTEKDILQAIDRKLEPLLERFARIDDRIGEIRAARPPECPHCGPLKGRVEDLELWRGKIHALMVEKTPKNNDKLSKYGRYVAGQKTH